MIERPSANKPAISNSRTVIASLIALAALGAGLLALWDRPGVLRDLHRLPDPVVRASGSSGPGAGTSAAGASMCAVPPAPGKTGFVATSRFGPPRHDRPFRHPGGPAFTRPLADTLKVIAIQVDFDDQPMDSTRAYFERVFFFTDQFWGQASNGQAVIATTVTDSVYRLPETMAYYGDDELFAERQTLFIRDTILAADNEIDYSTYDVHVCVHAGAGQEADVAGDSPEQLWSVFAPFEVLQYYLPDSTAEHGILTNDLTDRGDPFFVQFSLVLPEVESQDSIPGTNPPIPYVFGMTGVYCHEFGHAMGLPDLYDTTPEDFPDSQGVGSFDVMASGTWNANGFVPGRPSAWSLYDLGWADAQVVDRAARIELAAIAGEDPGGRPRLVAIPIGGDEYFLIENRVQDPNGNGLFDFNDTDNDSLFSFWIDDYEGAEFDFFLPGDGTGSGLLIWHIDPSTIDANFASNTVEADAMHKGVDLEEADGIQDMDGFAVSLDSFGSPDDAFRLGNRTRFAPDTSPGTESSYGVPSFVTIDSVSAAGPVMSFVLSFERRKQGSWPVAIDGPIGGNHPAVADLNPDDGDGLETVWADTTGGVWVVAANGGPPRLLGAVGPDLRTAPAVGDIDGDGRPEIVVAAEDGRIYAWNGEDGTEVVDGDSNPATSGVWSVIGRSLADVIPVLAPLGGSGLGVILGTPADGSGEGEVVWCGQAGSQVEVGRVTVPGDASTPPIVFSGASPVILAAVAVAGETRFYAIEPGTLAPPRELGAPLAGGLRTVRAMVAGDLDGNGFVDVVAADYDGQVAAYATSVTVSGDPILDDLALIPGWPFETGIAVAHDLSLADIDRDGRLEVLLSAFDGRLHAVNFNGTPQLFFPVMAGDPDRLPPRVAPAPLVFDLAGDAKPEVVYAPGDGRTFAIDGGGALLPGWPMPGPAAKGAVPVIEDLDGDGSLDLVVASDIAGGSTLIAFELGMTEGPGSAWRAYRGGPDHRGLYVSAPASPASQAFLSEFFVYPNPVDGDFATIRFSLGADEAEILIEILDPVGRVVARPTERVPMPGRTEHEVRWDVQDAASGVYLVRLEARGGGQEMVELRPFAVRR